MLKLTRKVVILCLIHLLKDILLLNCEEIDMPRGPWQLAFKVVSGNWDKTVTNYATFWELFTSSDTYNTESPVPDQRDFSTSSDHYKSDIVQQWEDGYISVQAIKLSFFKNNEEKAYVVFDAIGKTKTTWFKCDNILYSSYTDLPDNTLSAECPGRNVYNGLPLTLMKISYQMAYCPQTTGWLVVADTDFGFTLCPNYMPADGTEPKPYFKYASLTTIADLSTQLETADSMGIFFQVWDLAFKGVEGIKPSASGISNLTGLFLSDLTENDNSDLTVRNLQHTQSSQIFKSDVINLWNTYFIDMVKFSMLKSGVEHAYVVFDGVNTDKTSWFSESDILYSSYGSSLNDAAMEVCSIEGDTYRTWQIQSVANDAGCSGTEQMGWMLVKEPKNNGTCSWDTGSIKKKPYFLYNTGSAAANPSLFQYADVLAVFVHGWRLVLKVSSGGSVSPKSSIYSLWTETGGLNEEIIDAATLSSSITFKSSVINQWASYYIRAVKIAAYKNDMEVFNAVFDATGSGYTDWLDCNRLLYSSVTGLTRTTAFENGYTCSLQGESSTFRFFIGKTPNCETVSASGGFFIVDADSTCSSRNDRPLFLFSNTLDASLTDKTDSQLADTFAVFIDMANCYTDTCLNGATCQDLGGNFRCFCAGSYYGDTCANLDGAYGAWSPWSDCSVSCATGTRTRTRACTETEGDGICVGESTDTFACTLDPCPIDGVYTEWNTWSQCTVTCGTGTRTRSRECTNPAPQYGGSICVDPSSESQNCNTLHCPIDGGMTDWSDWSACSVTCDIGTQSRERTCTNPAPQHGGVACTGGNFESTPCDLGSCPIDGGYTEWSEWGICSMTCGGGQQSRTRKCTNPVPLFGGSPCSGVDTNSQTCNTIDCPIDGEYTEWSIWGTCSMTCGSGQQSRTRDCTNPIPQFGGSPCSGVDTNLQTCNTIDCPIDGGYTEWSVWSTCSMTCGGGQQSRTRDCSNPVPQFGGIPCLGNDTDTQTCNGNECPIDGGYTEWNEWGTCSMTCGGGQQSRTRDCTNPIPQYGGIPCSGVDTDTQACNTHNCPLDGGYSEWNEWGICSMTCGGGEQSRSRDCSNPVPQFGGSPCSDDYTDTQNCNTHDCPIDGRYTEWNEWGSCSMTCGGGQQSRTRDCSNPVPQFGGSPCLGNDTDTQTCNGNECPIDGGYTEWSVWSTCSMTCGGGQQSRTRDCSNPVPQFGGSPCLGNDTDTQTCNGNECPIDGGYTEWSVWSTCSMTCGGGQQSRTRDCSNPVPQFGGSPCLGSDTDTQTCNGNECPIDGGYTEWNEWGSCSMTCGGGQQSRTRDCSNPVPQFEGSPCLGNDTDTQTCNGNECPIDGVYADWSEWGICSMTCGGGQQSRTRDCTNPPPQFGGSPCSGGDIGTQTCNANDCPIDGEYTEWNEWGTCSMTCGGGHQFRTRKCTNPIRQFGGRPCSGVDTNSQTCNTIECPIDGGYTGWSEWGTCSMTCGGGQQSRTRECTNPIPQFGGSLCSDDDTDTQICNTNDCPIDGGFTKWSEWSTCSMTCGGGQQYRLRDCSNPVPQFDGRPCSGNDTDTQTCNRNECPIDGEYTEWSEWGICSMTCGGGQQSRTRDCTNPPPQFGGSPCSGVDIDTQSCDTNDCPIDGGYAEWNEWGACSMTCGGGHQLRTRECTNPNPQFGGSPCSGVNIDTQVCNTNDCPIDGGYTEWSVWGTCSMTCGGGEQSRTRECTNPVPQFGGSPCADINIDTQTCNTIDCPIDGGYTEWSVWGTCSMTCGGGEQSRTRECTNPVPQFGGSPCADINIYTQTCYTIDCPIDGGYTEWSVWGTCSMTCGGGEQSRTRECTNPVPQFGGSPCADINIDTQTCNTNDCPIDGGYTEWSVWGTCSMTCGVGQQSRTRECTNPVHQFGGSPCADINIDTQTCNTIDCPIDGGYTEWNEWGSCLGTCGGGQQSRTRDCSNPIPQFGGSMCSGMDTESQTCNTNECPIDGGYSVWSEWGTCSMTCGGGEQSRTRVCTNPIPQFGGSPCSGVNIDTQTCITNDCPIDGGYTEWSEWGTCSMTCGGGEQSRTRDCTNPIPHFEGSQCYGGDIDTQLCYTNDCPIDGGYTDWSEWGICSMTCGGGQRSRSRDCSNPIPQFGGSSCSGGNTDTQNCNIYDCPIDGGFTAWSEWGTCSGTCGGGQQFRTRECTSPVPQFGGNLCSGVDIHTQACNTNDCPIDSGYTEWSEWGTCSVTCGDGEQFRSRVCSNPLPQFGGSLCLDDDIDVRICFIDYCRIDGGLTEWSMWSACSVSCGDGEIFRSRECTNPYPEYGGDLCSGNDVESDVCSEDNCPVDGGFSGWSIWSMCTKTCGSGQQTRLRDCNNPIPQYGGNDCSGVDTVEIDCSNDPCPDELGFSTWSEWTSCTKSCDLGIKARSRECLDPKTGCTGATIDTGICNAHSCPIDGGYTAWTEWSTCSVTCGDGEKSRTRECSNPVPEHGGASCEGEAKETSMCKEGICQVDGYLTDWGEWEVCSASCGGGTHKRIRTCVEPLNGGDPCVGARQQTNFCNTQLCPVDGSWSEWAEWGNCSEKCAGGTRIRNRTCIGPLNGGEDCVGISQDNETCNEDPCPIDGFWSEWNEWNSCTVTCDSGTQERKRTCTGPQYGGKDCPGTAVQTNFCNTQPCPVNGVWLGWSEWSTCSASCAGGSHNRTRACVEPVHGGEECAGEPAETDSCNEDPCPVDGSWQNWSNWSSCSVSCADGVRNRSRTCVGPLYGGSECVGEGVQSEACNHGNCPIDGYWLEWSEWTKCTKTCGGGLRNKTRTCNEPLYGGQACGGEASEMDTCNIDACPIDGEWSDWTQWSTCTATCGGGTSEKTRMCSEPKYGGKFCEGEESETDMCNIDPCPVDGYWKEWSNWTECTVSCQGGSRDRYRTCVEQRFGGRACEGNDVDTEECNTQFCPVDGVWTAWSEWSQCSSTCSGGARNRTRNCIKPMYGGKTCEGNSADIQMCGIEVCPPVDGGWAFWTAWTACSMTCGFAERLRNRTCTDPTPQWGGRYCEGVHIQSDSCKENDCPVDGEWTEWTDWSACFNMTVNNVTNPKCGHGFKQRNRSCDDPAPQFEGDDCTGDAAEVTACNVPCHKITCSKEHPEQCQIIFEYIPENRGSTVTMSCSVEITIVFIFMIRIILCS